MIISVSPPSSVSVRSIEKNTKAFFGRDYLISKNKYGLLATGNNSMVLVKKREILISFSVDDLKTINLLQDYLISLFKNVYIGVDMKNPITDKLNFVVNLTQGMIS